MADKALGSSVADIVINPAAVTSNAINPVFYCLHTYHNIIRERKFKNTKNKWSTDTQAKLFTMKYHRFSRRSKKSLYSLHNYKNRKKSNYMINTDRSKMLDSGFFENQVWGALHKAWKGYVIAKNKDEYEKMVHYARIIRVPTRPRIRGQFI